MSTFMRSAGGMKNYALFFGADFTLYIEGRCLVDEPIEDLRAFDHKYYDAIAKTFLPEKSVKIKLVGGKNNALNYHEQIIKNNTTGSFVLIDKDLDGVIFNRFKSKYLLSTNGYSWENDFWTNAICSKTLNTLTLNEPGAIKTFNSKLNTTIPRLKKIASLGACAQANGVSLFPIDARSKGINIQAQSKYPIKKEEFSRIFRAQYQKDKAYCSCTLGIYNAAMKMPTTSIIQGHLYEHVVLTLMSHEYKQATRETTCSHAILKRVAFSNFTDSPLKYLTEGSIAHYRREFSKIH
jgi:hypothetical protein